VNIRFLWKAIARGFLS